MSFDDFVAMYDEFSRDYPVLGPVLGSGTGRLRSASSPTTRRRALGDVRVDHVPPLLLIGTTADPATPYAGAQDLQQRIVGSTLLTVDDTQHGGYATGNVCVDKIVDTYLISGAVPAPDAALRWSLIMVAARSTTQTSISPMSRMRLAATRRTWKRSSC